MSRRRTNSPPPDQMQRDKALDPRSSILVRAPAGSGKTTLLANRFLSLLAEVDDPAKVLAITFTKAAAAEMRNKILDELRMDEPSPIAQRALHHAKTLDWNLLDFSTELRISTIDSFCRELALQQPLLSGLGGSLEIFEQPSELYRRAARRALQQIGKDDAALSQAIETLLLWRDNNWQDLEAQLIAMLGKRDQWMHDFVLARELDWEALREKLEQPFLHAAASSQGSLRYSDEEWKIVRACFTLLRHAAGELKVVFAEAAAADYIEVAQIAERVLKGEDGSPNEATLAIADNIRHLLVDEFQDTNRRQHQLLAHLIAAWPEREGRTCFVVGDPMQSIYSFRNADAELFPRVEQIGLEIPGELPMRFELVELTANFRTVASLVGETNEAFGKIFAVDDGSGIEFAEAAPARDEPAPVQLEDVAEAGPRLQLHIEFMPQSKLGSSTGPNVAQEKERIREERDKAREAQTQKIVGVIRGYRDRIEQMIEKNTQRSEQDKEKYLVAVLGRTRKALETVAAALRRAEIPFRAIELEKLKGRQEVIDALALARALFNPRDRVAWLGVLRAPWCGLPLADLYTLASADDREILAQPVPELMAGRMSLLSSEGQAAVERVMGAIEFAESFRSAQPTAALGTWLEQVWLQLSGAECVDAEARANVDLLWRSLDNLPQGEPDLLGPALDAALEKLAALPDSNADSGCGVQLMTIHHAKGLEFDVVIVPDLQAETVRGSRDLLSWLERGLLPEHDAEETGDGCDITEFLIAPLPPKGAKGGDAKKWVDGVRSDRERQEARRIFYVACTRARDELHLFARPEYKTEKDASLSLVEPRESLLRTAWPAFSAEIESRFGEWITNMRKSTAEPCEVESGEVESIAASGESNVVEMPAPVDSAPARATQLRRLPADFRANDSELPPAPADAPLLGPARLYERHEGGLASRAFGRAVHALLETLAQQLETLTIEAACASLVEMKPRIAAQIRAAGVEAGQAGHLAEQAVQIALKAAADPIGKWILSPHAEAANEIRWTGVVAGSVRTVQVDRVFRAGAAPQPSGAPASDKAADHEAWWIIDYKTAHEDGLDRASALPELHRKFAPQIEAYAKILRNLHGASVPVRGGLYYPRMGLLDWWEL